MSRQQDTDVLWRQLLKLQVLISEDTSTAPSSCTSYWSIVVMKGFGQLGSKHRDLLGERRKDKDDLTFFIQANISMFHYALGSKFNTFEYMGATIIYFLKILLKLNFQICIKLFRHLKKNLEKVMVSITCIRVYIFIHFNILLNDIPSLQTIGVGPKEKNCFIFMLKSEHIECWLFSIFNSVCSNICISGC